MLLQDLIIRDASLNDTPAIIKYNLNLARETENKNLNASILTSGVQQALTRSDLCRYIIAESMGRVIGQTMITFEWSDWRSGVIWWLQSVYVDKKYRRMGVFRSLFQHIKKLAIAEKNVRGIRLYVERHNDSGIQVYKSLGVKPTGYLIYENNFYGASDGYGSLAQ